MTEYQLLLIVGRSIRASLVLLPHIKLTKNDLSTEEMKYYSAVFPTCHIITCCSSLIMQIAAVLSLPVAPSSAAHVFFMVFIVENWATALFDMKHDVLICYLLSPWQLCDQRCWLFFSCSWAGIPECFCFKWFSTQADDQMLSHTSLLLLIENVSACLN